MRGLGEPWVVVVVVAVVVVAVVVIVGVVVEYAYFQWLFSCVVGSLFS